MTVWSVYSQERMMKLYIAKSTNEDSASIDDGVMRRRQTFVEDLKYTKAIIKQALAYTGSFT
eukprot:CAMPEP_0197247056 /NCGR_PEP_ID=MMETSP1429-20130617/26071_1 /TAXON_ID=49237 /ORGANISM="Chaetoceros  sp., Strain UNC1202" /LENGTH=61 /DNA_ID=CAMNT_0042707863 /DNA_START=35 /DNA_END=217 /DNA_ORIENTATION=+